MPAATDSPQVRLEAWLRADPFRMAALKAARAVKLPDWCLSAGFVRSLVWDKLHGFSEPTPLPDLDLIYFRAMDEAAARAEEAAAERQLAQLLPAAPFEVRNQARMHVKNGVEPYFSMTDGLARFLETPTASGVRLEDDDNFSFIMPHGFDDLFALIVRPTPAGLANMATYRARVADKNWPARWPNVQVLMG